jgi:hypothetical protein
VPALSCAGGIDVVGKGKEYGKKLEDDYTANATIVQAMNMILHGPLMAAYRICKCCFWLEKNWPMNQPCRNGSRL